MRLNKLFAGFQERGDKVRGSGHPFRKEHNFSCNEIFTGTWSSRIMIRLSLLSRRVNVFHYRFQREREREREGESDGD